MSDNTVTKFLKDYKQLSNDEYVGSNTESKSSTYVFASFDLCNSTELKRKIRYWFDIIKTFLSLSNRITQMNCWKFNGDEILYYAEIKSVFEILGIIEESYSFIDSVKSALTSTLIKKDYFQKAETEYELNQLLNLLDVRGTIWIAQTDLMESQDDAVLNYRFTLNKGMDFSGINVDEGFRLRNWSSKHRLIVDPKIVAILYVSSTFLQYRKFDTIQTIEESSVQDFITKAKNYNNHDEIMRINNFVKNFRVLGYQPCKGVWNGHLYPIVWYSNDWKNVSKSLSYDEKFDDHFVINIISSSFLKDNSNKIYQIPFLLDVLLQVKELDTVIRILNDLCFQNNRGQQSTTTKLLNSSTNLYYMVACVNPKSNMVLLFKRSECRKHLKGVWDFGNIKHIASSNVAMDDIIRRQYKSLFDIDINVACDLNRDCSTDESVHPVLPLALCTVHRNGRMHNGILCVATITGEHTDEELKECIMKKIEQSKKEYPDAYQYSEVDFVDATSFEKKKFVELKMAQIEKDSVDVSLEQAGGTTFEGQRFCINNCKDSIIKAIKYVCETKEGYND